MKNEKIVILRDTDKMIRYIKRVVDYLDHEVLPAKEETDLINDGRDIIAHYREKHEEDKADTTSDYMRKQYVCRKCAHGHTPISQEPCLSCTSIKDGKALRRPTNFKRMVIR